MYVPGLYPDDSRGELLNRHCKRVRHGICSSASFLPSVPLRSCLGRGRSGSDVATVEYT
jgi:hypothetical protein